MWKVFDSVPVLRGISFDLMAGEIHALLGGNGSGKSTTVKILCGAHKPTAGIIELNGQPQSFDRPSDAHAKGIYMVPQSRTFSPIRRFARIFSSALPETLEPIPNVASAWPANSV